MILGSHFFFSSSLNPALTVLQASEFQLNSSGDKQDNSCLFHSFTQVAGGMLLLSEPKCNMKQKIVTTLVLVFIMAGPGKSIAQNCGGPMPVITVYYPFQPGTCFAAGLEAGYQGMDSPFGFFAGFNLQSFSNTRIKKDSTENSSFRSSFYLKGSFRLCRLEGVTSLYLVMAPQLSKRSDMDLRSGLRLMFPLGEKNGIGLEPLYSIREKNIMVNLMLAF